VTDDEVTQIARLLAVRNAIDDAIAAIIHRPMATGISASGSPLRYSMSNLSRQLSPRLSTAGSGLARCRVRL